MRKLLVAALAVVALVGLTLPAQAIWKGKICKTFAGPDGSGGVEVKACVLINDHDLEDKIQAAVELTNTGTKVADARIGYLALQNTVGTVRNNGPFVLLMDPGDRILAQGNWLWNPYGTYHSRVRMWMCWPSINGDPCGNPVVWNSGTATYP